MYLSFCWFGTSQEHQDKKTSQHHHHTETNTKYSNTDTTIPYPLDDENSHLEQETHEYIKTQLH